MLIKKRNFGLDLLRAISIVLVLIAHKVTVPPELAVLGALGVQVFFILSGFLIGQILLSDFKNDNSFSTVLHFWKRRWFRTLPLYYLVLTSMLFIKTNPLGWKVLVYYFFLQANFIGIDFFPVSWSLVVEEWFYIFLPLASLTFFFKGIKPKSFLIFTIFFISFFFCARFCWNYFEKGVILYQFDCLLLGVLLATLKMYYNSFYERLAAWPFALMGLIGIICLVVTMGDIGAHGVFDSYFKVTWYLLLSTCISLVLPFFEKSQVINQTLVKLSLFCTLITWTSILSYSLYLLHPTFYSLTFDFPFIIETLFQFILLVSISLLLYVFYERPVMNLRDDFSLKSYFYSVKSALKKT